MTALAPGITSHHILVAGSAALNVTSRPAGNATLHHCRQGPSALEIGGTAANIAINLATAGREAALLTALNRSGISSLIAQHLHQAGVRLYAARTETLEDAVNSIHLDDAGRIISLCASDTLAAFRIHESMLDHALDAASCLVMDTDLSAETMETLADKAQDLDLPFAIVVSNEMTATRIARISWRPNVLFLTRREAQRLSRLVGAPDSDLVALSAALSCSLVISMGHGHGTTVVDHGEAVTLANQPHSSSGNELGIAHALAAHALALHFMDNIALTEAVRQAMGPSSRLPGWQASNRGEIGSVEKSIRQWRQRAMYDEMTGTLNRQAVAGALDKAADEARLSGTPLSLMIIDLDHLKQLNDTVGHHAGDEAIMAISEAITMNIDRDHVGRIGGDEFVCFIPHATVEQTKQVADRIAKDLAAASNIAPLTASIGIAGRQPDDAGVAPLMRRADLALYNVKRNGRNGSAIYSPGMLAVDRRKP